MTRKEIVKELYRLKKDKLPNVIGLNRPLTEDEFIQRYLNSCGGCKSFSKDELMELLKIEYDKLDKRNGLASA